MNEETFDGVAWLEKMADRYEAIARRLRENAAMVREFEAIAVEFQETNGNEPVLVSEAVRRAMSHPSARNTPQTAATVWKLIVAQKIVLRTRSNNPRNLIDSTLVAMTRAGHLKRVTDGWILP